MNQEAQSLEMKILIIKILLIEFENKSIQVNDLLKH